MTRLRIDSLRISVLLVAAALAWPTASRPGLVLESMAQTPTASSQTDAQNSGSAATRPPVLDVTDIKIEMAEASLRVNSSDRNLTALISALEDYLNARCFGTLRQSLSYQGPPTDPDCVTRMNQLLEINPDNPAATCVRDGIDAPSCATAYKGQKLVQFYDSASLLADLPDPALKVGLSAADTERVKVQQEMLRNIDSEFRAAQTDEEKAKCVNDAVGIYEQLLNTACKVSALRLRRLEEVTVKADPPRIAEARKKLLQIPVKLRPDYQRQMRTQVEEEIEAFRGDESGRKELAELLAVIDQPEETKSPAMMNLQRTRIVLRSCYEAIDQAKQFIPLFPAPLCYQEGWYTPQCTVAIRAWRKAKELERKRASVKPGATPTPQNVISSF